MSTTTISLPYARFTKDHGAVTAAGAAPTTTSNGVAVTFGWNNETAHLFLAKNSTATVKVYGMTNIGGTGTWGLLDTVVFAGTENEAAPVRSVTAYQRVHATVSAIGASGSLTAYWGFSE